MRVWLFSVGIFFVLAQIYVWLQDFLIPLPIYILGGAVLAIASNYESGNRAPSQEIEFSEANESISQTATIVEKKLLASEEDKSSN